MRLAGLLLGMLLLCGCGQKGPLYLPDKNPSVVTHPAAPAATAPVSPAAKKPTDTEADPAAAPAAPVPPK